VGSEEAVPQVNEVAVDGELAGGDARRVVEVVDARQEEVGVDLEVVAGDRRRIRLPPGVMAHRRVCDARKVRGEVDRHEPREGGAMPRRLAHRRVFVRRTARRA
jgi:hypothetical protein